MVTCKDVAERAGVSRATVDRVLNNRGRVSEETIARVRQIAEEMGYQPNLFGQGLAVSKKQLKIGFGYLDDESVPFYQIVYRSAKAYAEELVQYGVKVEFFPMPRWSWPNLEGIRKIFGDIEMDGWVMDGLCTEIFLHSRHIEGKPYVPVVAYNFDAVLEQRLAYVGCSYEKAGRLACGLAALISDGKARIGIVSSGSGEMSSARERIHGFEKELREHYEGMEIIFRQFIDCQISREAFLQSVGDQLEKIDVLYLVNPGNYDICDYVCETMGERKPRIITNDLVSERQKEMIRSGRIAATIDQEPEVQGRKSLEILFEYLAFGKRPEKEKFYTELSILIRQNI